MSWGGNRGWGNTGNGGRFDDRNWSRNRVPNGVYPQSYNPDIDPFIQRLRIERQGDQAVVKMNYSQCFSIFGDMAKSHWRNNYIYREIISMTKADIELLSHDEDSVFRTVSVKPGQGDATAVDNSLWLMEICINAFTDMAGVNGSVACFKAGFGLETVVASGCYGEPPGLAIQQQVPDMMTNGTQSNNFTETQFA